MNDEKNDHHAVMVELKNEKKNETHRFLKLSIKDLASSCCQGDNCDCEPVQCEFACLPLSDSSDSGEWTFGCSRTTLPPFDEGEFSLLLSRLLLDAVAPAISSEEPAQSRMTEEDTSLCIGSYMPMRSSAPVWTDSVLRETLLRSIQSIKSTDLLEIYKDFGIVRVFSHE